jgi:hypothetical protein
MTFHGVFADAMNLPCICDICWMSLHCDDVTRGPHRLQDYLSLISVDADLLQVPPGQPEEVLGASGSCATT